MKKSIIFLDAVILLTVSCIFVIGLDLGFNFIKGKEKPDSPIILAATNRKSTEELDKILKENSDTLTHRDPQDRTPLIRVCNSNLKDNQKRREADQYISALVPLFIKYNVNLEDKDNDGWTPLMWASWSNLPSVVTSLIEAGADLNVTDKKGNTPLSVSLHKEGSDVAGILNSPLVLGILTRQTESNLIGLMDSPDSLTKRDSLGRTPLMLISIVNMEEGDKLNEKDSYLAEAARLMVGKGAKIDDVDSEGKTALTWAASSNLTTMSKALIELGANTDTKDKSNSTALMHAVINNNPAVVSTLLDSGADINAQNKDGNTALHLAVTGEYKSITEILLNKGADQTLKNKKGRTAADIVQKEETESLYPLFGLNQE